MKLILMSFDGEYQTEKPKFPTAQKAWEYADNLGSKWFFYPFAFVVDNNVKTIVDTPNGLEYMIDWLVSDVVAEFAETNNSITDNDRITADDFIMMLWDKE